MTPLITPDIKTTYQQIKILLESQRVDMIQPILQDEHPADIADLLELLSNEERALVFEMLTPEVASEVLDEIDTRSTRSLVDSI